MRGFIFLGASAAVILAAPAIAMTSRPHHAVHLAAAQKAATPAVLTGGAAPAGLPAGAQLAVVSGNPAAAGAFTIRLKMPANYSVPAHWHPTDEKVSVVSGKLAYGMSDRLNRTSAQGLNAGESVIMKAKMNHWVLTADGAEIEVGGTGPFKITYVNAADDPRGAAKPK